MDNPNNPTDWPEFEKCRFHHAGGTCCFYPHKIGGCPDIPCDLLAPKQKDMVNTKRPTKGKKNNRIKVIYPHFTYTKKLIKMYEEYARVPLSAIAFAAKREIAAAEEYFERTIGQTENKHQKSDN